MKIRGIVSVFLWLVLSHLSAADENEYSNPTLGITIIKPEAWHFATAAEVSENLEHVELNDEGFEAFMKKQATAPTVALTRFDDPYDDLNPTIKVNIRSLGKFSPDDPVRILEFISKPQSKVFADFKFATEPKEVELAGMKAAYMCFDYTLKTPDGWAFPTRSELWIVPHGNVFSCLEPARGRMRPQGPARKFMKS